MLVLTAALALAVAFILLLPAIRERYPSAKVQVEVIPSTFRTLEVRKAQEISSVTVYPAAADSYTLRMRDGALYLELEGELRDINDLYAQELLEVFTHIVAQETVTEDASEVEEHLLDMGLAPAKAKAVIRYQDGSEATLEVGGPVPHTTYAYYRWSGDPGIYMCDVGITEALALTQSHLLPVSQPVVYPSLVSGLRLANAKGESRFAFEAGTTGALVEPFAYPLADTAVDQLLSAVENFRLGTREDVITDENRAFYGFDQPLCTVEIHQQAGVTNQIGADGALTTAQVPAQSLRFVIGRAQGDYFYTCEYEGDCYFISRFLAETLVGVDRDSLLSRNPASMGDALIASVAISAPEGTLAVDVLRAERVLPNNQLEMDENGNLAYDTLIAINGQEGTQEQLDELISRLQTLTAAGSVPDDFALADAAQPRWSITVETTGGDVRQIDAYRMDAFSDALVVDGVMRHYVHSDAIDVVTAGLL